MKEIDWLGLEIDFDDKLRNKLFESQRQTDYTKWLNYLLDQREAYRCFCKTSKCNGKCDSSKENADYNNASVFENLEINFVKFKNNPNKYSIKDIINNEEIMFISEDIGPYNIFTRRNKDIFYFSSVYKRVIEDEIYKTTHKFEIKGKFNYEMHHILTK